MRTVAKAPGQAVFLVGFMGAGKSSVGRALALHLGCEFEDLDDRIQRRERRSVADIFRDSGEATFRESEHAALDEVLSELKAGVRVVALGGGAFVQKANVALLKAAKVSTIFLDAPLEELWSRCWNQAAEAGLERPLLQNREGFERLYGQRRKAYSKALLRVETGGRALEEIAVEIAKKLRLNPRTGQGAPK